MKKKIVFGFIMLTFLFACSTKENKEQTEKKVETPQVSITELLENADHYVDQAILFTGTVDHVCREGGKKMFLIGNNPESRIKVTPGKNMPSFDVELEGSDLMIEGVLQALVIDEDYLAKWEEELTAKHDAQEEGHAQTEHGENADQGLHVGDKQQIDSYRKMLEESGEDKITFYSVECSKFTKQEGNE